MHVQHLFLFAAGALCAALPQQETGVTIGSPPPGGCLLPDTPSYGEYTSTSCKPGDPNAACDNVPGTPVPAGWTIKYRCFRGYDVSSVRSGLSVCDNGVWNNPIKCVNCGVANKNTEPLIADGRSTATRDYPWLVAIYLQHEAHFWSYFCSGTLISPTSVLTAAYCVTASVGELINLSNVKVGLGKYFRDYYKQESNSIIAEVRKIIIPKRYPGPLLLVSMDIALLDLSVSVPMSNHIMPACVDWPKTRVFKPNNTLSEGYVPGWDISETGLQTNGVQATKLKYFSQRECIKEIDYVFKEIILVDNFCATVADNETGSDVGIRSGGGGMTVVEDGVHYVVGVVSYNLGNQPFSLFTNLKGYLMWLESEKTALERIHHPELEIEEVEEQTEEATQVPQEKDPVQQGAGDGMCLLKPKNKNGCGASVSLQVHRIHFGKVLLPGQFPWLAALYMKDTQNNWELVCGGTLISSQAVLTAAHCLVLPDRNIKPENIKVGLGKLSRDFYVNEDPSVIVDVIHIDFPTNYLGAVSNYALDVAVLKLSVPVKTTIHISPVCIIWDEKTHVAPGTTVHVAGWGKSENGTLTDIAYAAELSYLAYPECFLKCQSSYRAYITHDKICSVNVNGSEVDRGDSGGGLTVVKEGRHFLIGIVSTKIIGEITLSIFTDVSNPEVKALLTKQMSWLD